MKSTSNPALGPPWTHSEESQPSHSDAGTEVEAMFFTERMARQPNLYEMLERSRVRRAGPIGLMEARVLGSELHANAQAKLLGKAFPIMQWLDPVEREVLVLMEKPLALPELLALSSELNFDKEAVYGAVSSLLQRRLVLLT